MSKICSFRREFSEIFPLQKEHRFCYEAEYTEKENEIRFTMTGGQKNNEKEELLVTGLGKENAIKLMRFLWENAIPLEYWKSILEESIVLIKNSSGKGRS